MKSAVVIRHVHFEDLGGFAPVLERQGYQVRYLDPGLDELPAAAADDADMVIVLGGPIGAYEDDLYPFLHDELALIGRRLAGGRPLLGVCLGAQLIARALGARVYPGAAKEIGWSPLTLTDAGRESPLRSLDNLPVLHWHGDTFDLPEGAVRLASTPICANQAFAVGGRVLALQFHPEAAEAGFERWLVGHACEIAGAPGVTVPGLRAQARELAANAAASGQACLDAWLAGLEPVAAVTTPETVRA
jgi:GMP synthase (glutamine-hydrolysing)